jgi:DNA polymerase-3 subunit delta
MLDNIKSIDIKNLPSILLLFGEEEYLREEALNYLIKNIAPQVSADYDMDILNSDEASLDKIVDIASSYPFLSAKRTLVVKNFNKYFSGRTSKKSIEKTALYKLIQSPPPTAFIILSAEIDSLNGITKQLSQNSNHDKALKTINSAKFPFDQILGKHEWIEYPKVWENTFPAWIKNRMKSKGKNISEAAIQIIVSHTNPTLRDIGNELDKLAIYVLDKTEISEDDAINVVGASRQFNVFELQKSVGKMDLNQSLFIMQNMLSVDRAEMLILSILTRFFIALWKLVEAGQVGDHNKYEIARQIGVSPFFLNDYVQALNKYGYKRVDRSFEYLCATDLALKTSSGSSLYLLQKMLIQIME